MLYTFPERCSAIFQRQFFSAALCWKGCVALPFSLKYPKGVLLDSSQASSPAPTVFVCLNPSPGMWCVWHGTSNEEHALKHAGCTCGSTLAHQLCVVTRAHMWCCNAVHSIVWNHLFCWIIFLPDEEDWGNRFGNRVRRHKSYRNSVIFFILFFLQIYWPHRATGR